MSNNKLLGNKGEDWSKAYLESRDYRIITSNYYRKNIGEVDIIACKNDLIIFIEVKTRRNLNYGYGLESVDLRKQEKIRNTSLVYLVENPHYQAYQIRYDVIDIYMGESLEINHIRNAF